MIETGIRTVRERWIAGRSSKERGISYDTHTVGGEMRGPGTCTREARACLRQALPPAEVLSGALACGGYIPRLL